MNLPNKLTMARILATPVFLLLAAPLPVPAPGAWGYSFAGSLLSSYNGFISGPGKYAAGVVFVLAFITDAVDGYIARKRNLVTDFGKFLDPIADKLMVTAALVVLLGRGEINAWAVAIIISREFIITGLRLIAASGAGLVIAAGRLGKLKTIAQFIALTFALFDNLPFSVFTKIPFDDIFMFCAVVLTIISGAGYIINNKELLK